VKARVRVERDGDDLGVYAPAISSYPNFGSGIGTPSVRTGLFRDLYLTLVSSPNESGLVTIGVQINPMVLWLWIGGALMGLGTIIALLPARKRVVLPREAPAETPELAEVPA
jgi:cytochrome c-type biogenesis protein CcmF